MIALFKREKFTILAVRPDKNNEKGPMASEQIFATLHGMLQPFFSFQFLNGFFRKKISFAKKTKPGFSAGLRKETSIHNVIFR